VIEINKYMEYNITQLHRDNFKPTFLYIKQHSVTGKLYFGKTARKNVERYTGSGIHWGRHVSSHGKDKVVTLWYCLFTDIDTLVNAALEMSVIMNITDSGDWLNFKPESGLDGGSFKGFNGFTGRTQTEHQKAVVTELGKVRPATDRMRENMAVVGSLPRTEKQIAASVAKAQKMGKANSKPVTLDGITYPSKRAAAKKLNVSLIVLDRLLNGLPAKVARKPLTEEQLANVKRAANNRPPQEKKTCPHCGKSVDAGNYKRYHGDNCKLRPDSPRN